MKCLDCQDIDEEDDEEDDEDDDKEKCPGCLKSEAYFYDPNYSAYVCGNCMQIWAEPKDPIWIDDEVGDG